MTTVPACRAEFGLLVCYHVPYVHALPGPKVVEIEEGNEALYPSATEWRVVPRGEDDARRGMLGWSRPKGAPEARFLPEPHVPQGIPRADIVVCPRKRAYGSAKNWPHWRWLAEALQSEGASVFAGGAPDSSYDVPCDRAWDHPRFLDATIEAMRSARLLIATDAGLAHLAVLCGTPLLMITHGEGRVAPGAVMDPSGRVMEREYWPVKLHRYHEANHTGAPIHVLHHGWERRGDVLREALGKMERAAA